jgi:primosomal protein N'
VEEEKNLNICTECGYAGPEEDICPECGGSMASADEMGKDEMEEEAEE